MSSLATRIREALDALDEGNQADLARACGVKPPSVNAWLSGKTKSLKGETLLRAATYLRVRPNWLATGRGPKVPTEAGEPPAEPTASHNALEGVVLSDVLQYAPQEERRRVLDEIRMIVVRARARFTSEELARNLDALDRLDSLPAPGPKAGRGKS